MKSSLLGIVALLSMPFAAQAQDQEIHYFMVQSGTGFYVNRDYIITNEHVVRGCTKVDIEGPLKEHDDQVLFTDSQHDLALIRVSSAPENFAPMRTDIGTLKPGDDVTILGYPGVSGIEGKYKVMHAQVEKLDFNNIGRPWQFYFTDVVEHGNSGGPVLDSAGNVIGVVVAKMVLDTRNALTNEKVGEQHLGVAITLNALQGFMEDHGVYIQWGGSGGLTLENDLIENNAKSYIVNVQCRQLRDGPPPQPDDEKEEEPH